MSNIAVAGPCVEPEPRFYVGRLCLKRHFHRGTEFSLRHVRGGECVQCRIAKLAAQKTQKAAARVAREADPGYAKAHSKEWYRLRRADPITGQRMRDNDKRLRATSHRAEYMRAYKKQWRRDPNRRINDAISDGLRRSLGGRKAGISWTKILPYTTADLKTHLEARFDDTMTWDNYGSHWSIDHVVPLSAFTFTGRDDPLVTKAWALTNLRPLSVGHNSSKSNKLVLFGDSQQVATSTR